MTQIKEPIISVNIVNKNYDKYLKQAIKSVLSQSFKSKELIIIDDASSDLSKEIIEKYKKKIITDIDLFFIINKTAKSIVVTGTNGKSTTCKLLAHLLKKNKINCSLGGNIGIPILDLKNFKKKYCYYF